jgi:hypothetical protein
LLGAQNYSAIRERRKTGPQYEPMPGKIKSAKCVSFRSVLIENFKPKFVDRLSLLGQGIRYIDVSFVLLNYRCVYSFFVPLFWV